MSALDLSYWADPEPLEFTYVGKTYSAPHDMPSVLHARIAMWCYMLTTKTEAEAEKESVALTAEVFDITPEEAASIAKPARKTMLTFLANGQLPTLATPQ